MQSSCLRSSRTRYRAGLGIHTHPEKERAEDRHFLKKVEKKLVALFVCMLREISDVLMERNLSDCLLSSLVQGPC